MLNRYPLWKYMLLLAITVFSVIYAIPNYYAPDPAIQISGQSAGILIDAPVLAKVEATLKEANIDYFGATLNGKSALIRFHSADQQMPARKRVQQSLGDDYVVALQGASTTPQWLQNIGAAPMKLGLDLAGGVHFLLEVDTASTVEKRQAITADEFKEKLRKAKIRYNSIISNSENVIIARFRAAEIRDQAMDELRDNNPQLLFTTADSKTAEGTDDFIFNAQLSAQAVKEIEDYALNQNLVTLRNRVNELGVSESIVQREGRNRIIVQLPGVQDPAEAKRVIGKTANLEFRMEASADTMVSNKEQFSQSENPTYAQAYLDKSIIVTGEQVADAKSSFDSENHEPIVSIRLDSVGGTKMNHVTRNAIGRRMGIVFIEYKTHTEFTVNAAGEQVEKQTQYVERKVISLATVQSALGVQFQITGLNKPGEASELALLLRAGALAAPMQFVSERTIGPSLGAENIKKGVTSCIWALVMVSLFMMVFYRMFGFFANIALAVNILLLITVLSMFGATLTLPGIAGIVLTMGMAVDANVLIYSRIREEMENGATPQQAIYAGYERAFITILDANITTMIIAIILFAVGTGPVKGFAITLWIGLATSMFTSIMISRAAANLFYGSRKNLQKLSL